MLTNGAASYQSECPNIPLAKAEKQKKHNSPPNRPDAVRAMQDVSQTVGEIAKFANVTRVLADTGKLGVESSVDLATIEATTEFPGLKKQRVNYTLRWSKRPRPDCGNNFSFFVVTDYGWFPDVPADSNIREWTHRALAKKSRPTTAELGTDSADKDGLIR